MDKNKRVFCRVIYYKNYTGTEFEPKFGNDCDMQYEKYNFRIIDGYMYGYCQTRSKSLGYDLKRISNEIDENHIDGCTVIFFAIKDNIPLVVGFYENATIYNSAYDNPLFKNSKYNIKVKSENGYLIPEKYRDIRMPKRGSNSWGESWVWYADKLENDEFIDTLFEKLKAVKPFCTGKIALINDEVNDEYFNNAVEEEINNKDKINVEEYVTTQYSRSSKNGAIALMKANYQCEYDNNHITFNRANGTNYTEAHHLIPVCLGAQSTNNIANIVSLCPNCHRWIHYGQNKEKIITKLFNDRKEQLEKIGKKITLDELIKIYQD